MSIDMNYVAGRELVRLSKTATMTGMLFVEREKLKLNMRRVLGWRFERVMFIVLFHVY